MSRLYGRRLLALLPLLVWAAAAGCRGSTEPEFGPPVTARVNQQSASPGALLPVRFTLTRGGAWSVNPCGYHFQLLVDGEWQRPIPVPPPCAAQPNIAVLPDDGAALEIPLPENAEPGTYRLVIEVGLGTPLDNEAASLAEPLFIRSNSFQVLPLF